MIKYLKHPKLSWFAIFLKKKVKRKDSKYYLSETHPYDLSVCFLECLIL